LVTWANLLGRPVQCQELDLMILKGPFQLRIFYDSINSPVTGHGARFRKVLHKEGISEKKM